MRRLLAALFVSCATAAAAGQSVLYISFGGETISKGDCDDARSNCSDLVLWKRTTIAPFDAAGYGDRAAFVERVRKGVERAFSGLGVRVVTTRPSSGSFHMVVVGGKSMDVLGMWVLGRAHVYCGGTDGSPIGFVTPFFDDRPEEKGLLDFDPWKPGKPGDPFHLLIPIPAPPSPPRKIDEWRESEAGIIRAVAHEAGHTYGLKHTEGFAASNPLPADLMCEQARCRDSKTYEFKRVYMDVEDAAACDGTRVQDSFHTLWQNINNR